MSVSSPSTLNPQPSTSDHIRGLYLCLICALVGFGTLMVHSASITSWPTEFEQVYLSRHAAFLAIGVLFGAAASALPARFWWKAAPWLFAFAALLLALVLIPGIGTRVNGAQRWLRYGPLSLQPSELAKIALPLLMARLLDARRDRLRHWFDGTAPVLLPAAVLVPLVVAEPDLGTGLFLAASAGVVLFAGGWPLRNFVLVGLVVVPACVGLIALRPYQVQRVTGFMAGWADFREAPYQMQQSLLSLGSGGTWGVGVGKGWQKLSFLPEANTDFVFAVVGEELGLVGTVGLIALWAGLYAAGLSLIRPLQSHRFASVAAFALLTQVVLQAALNVAVVTAMVPPKGIPHPLLSYGGSNLVVSLVSLGIVLGLTKSQELRIESQEPEAVES